MLDVLASDCEATRERATEVERPAAVAVAVGLPRRFDTGRQTMMSACVCVLFVVVEMCCATSDTRTCDDDEWIVK